MGYWEALAGLPLEIDGYELARRARRVSSDFERVTTVVRLRGAGVDGLGEDVTYDAQDQRALQEAGARLPLAGRFTLESFSAHLDRLELFPHKQPSLRAFRDYRRWAFESAAADLALRQRGEDLAGVLGLDWRPVRFVASLRLAEPPSADPVLRWLEQVPDLELKLDATSSWTPALIERLSATRAVVVVDFKGAYEGTPVDQPPDPALYARVAEAFPEAWLEDPALTPATDAVLREHRRRITWDAPIHSLADVEALPFPPRTINIKPSRAGRLERLFALYEGCRERGIGAYGGGQFELGPGRGQIQLLASLFHADGPNDTAPAVYNEPRPRAGVPTSPLDPAPERTGFRRREAR